MEPEIVKPDALKRFLTNVDGYPTILNALDLARMKLNWPNRSEKPPKKHIYQAVIDLNNLLDYPPEGYDVEEIPGSYFSIKIRRLRV